LNCCAIHAEIGTPSAPPTPSDALTAAIVEFTWLEWFSLPGSGVGVLCLVV
jgi:hypothetical protein